ncbi:MAG: response regulator, partial [Desulfobacterales bacterium]|nr:response regulator [Desulfobacterales bacterium]
MPNEKIMVIEDSDAIVMQIEAFLSIYNYSICSVVDSGEKAIKMINLLKPDIILMDITLAGEIDGIETAGIIRSNYDIPIIFLTSHTEDDFIDRAKNVSPYGYILKPFTNHDLRSAIEIALHKYKLDKKIKESEEKYHAVMTQATDVIYFFDINTKKILEANPSFENVFGYSNKDILNLSIYDLIVSDKKDVDEDIKIAVNIKKYNLGEKKFKRKNGETIIVEYSIMLIIYNEKKVL